MLRHDDLLARRTLCPSKRWIVSFVACCGLAGCGTPANVTDAPMSPEGATGSSEKSGWATRTYSVAAANPLATEAGLQMLRAGGSAIDAAIAIQMVLSLVEPQSSGIGGGAFLVHFDGKRTQAFDGRETAPAAATSELFLGPDGKPVKFADAAVGGRAVGIPGAVSMLALAHQQHGRLPWSDLFAPAIGLANQGFRISPRMATLLANDPHLKKDPVAADYFFDSQGQPWPQGHLLRNPELASLLQRIATEGPSALMMGDTAHAIETKVKKHASNPGTLSVRDLADYRPVVREPLCFDHSAQPAPSASLEPVATSVYRVCGMPPPSSGALAIGQILGILQNLPTTGLPLRDGLPQSDWLHAYGEASRLAFADRAQYVADPSYVQAPGRDWASMLAPAYLAERARLVDTSPSGKSRGSVKPGVPGATVVSYASMPDQIEKGTSHISVVDAFGNALAMTTSIEDVWGSRQMVNRGVGLNGGFLLNNQLTDFSFIPKDEAGRPVANRLEPGKRPRSSMAPTLVFDKATGQLVLSGGSPGGPLIIHFTAKTLLGVLNWGLNPQMAINLPNFGSLGGPMLLEDKRFPRATVLALQARGHTVVEAALPSGLQAIHRTGTGYFGGADPRREGVVMGD